MQSGRARVRVRLVLLCGVVSLVAACATPAERVDRRASAMGFSSVTLAGDGFRHRGYLADVRRRDRALHVYIEHDGSPWTESGAIADDPTPRAPLALELMALDSGPRLYLGRPCYFEARNDPRCTPAQWTDARYSEAVVQSMAAALRGVLREYSVSNVVLVGHSGGGTLAWLVASRIPEVSKVVTIAANLDTDEWTRVHGYTPLRNSLNPALLPSLSTSITQIHYVGERDSSVPPAVARAFAARHTNARVLEVRDFDHTCCWERLWPKLLEEPFAS